MFGQRRGGLRRIVADFVLAFTLIWMAVFAVGFVRDPAHAAGPSTVGALVRTIAAYESQRLEAAMPADAEDAGYTPARDDASQLQTYLLLSLAVAGLAALNLAFWRHLRRAYASPRRSTWRRG
jgi:hypothetical protein